MSHVSSPWQMSFSNARQKRPEPDFVVTLHVTSVCLACDFSSHLCMHSEINLKYFSHVFLNIFWHRLKFGSKTVEWSGSDPERVSKSQRTESHRANPPKATATPERNPSHQQSPTQHLQSKFTSRNFHRGHFWVQRIWVNLAIIRTS